MQTRYVDTEAAAGGDGTTSSLSGAHCAYKSLNVAEAALPATLTEPWEIIVGSAGNSHTADTTAVVFTGETTSAANYVSVYPSADARHAGVWSDTKYRLQVALSWSAMLKLQTNFIRIDGLQLYNTAAPANNSNALNLSGASGTGSDMRVTSCLLRGSLVVRARGTYAKCQPGPM